MAKSAYIGVGSIAKKIKRGYIGVGGVAKKIKNAYIGINGVAIPCWYRGELVYYGQLSEYICATVGASTSEHAIFSGSTSTTDIMAKDGYAYNYAYDNVLTLHRMSGMAYCNVAAASSGTHVLFAGGISSYGGVTNRVTAIDDSFTIINAPALTDYKCNMTGTTLGEYAIFGGGSKNTSSSAFSVAEVYDTKLSKINTDANFGCGGGSASTTIGGYAISGGGSTTGTSKVYACNSSLTNIANVVIDSLSSSKVNLAATSVGNYAILAGGGSWNGYSAAPSATLDVYNIDLTKFPASDLSSQKINFSGTTLDDFAIFSDSIEYDVYDSHLVHTSGSLNISTQNYKIGASTIGDYAIFVGEESNARYPHVFTLI